MKFPYISLGLVSGDAKGSPSERTQSGMSLAGEDELGKHKEKMKSRARIRRPRDSGGRRKED